MTAPRRGEIWKLGEHRGQSGAAELLVIQSDALAGAAPTLVGVTVTEAPQRAGEPLVVPLPQEARPDAAALGYAKITQVHTVPVAGVARVVGHVSGDVMARVDAALAEVLDLAGR